MGKILVVDDEKDVETLIMQRFRRAVRAGELEFLFAHDGQEALAMLRARPDIDMVLSDINMPGMDGLSLLDHLPQLNADIRAVMVSAYGDLGNVRAAMNRGAFDFIIKPIDFADLEATIHKTLEACRAVRRLRDALQETRTAEAASRAQAARMRRVLDGSPIGVSIITESGELLYCNHRCLDLFGLAAEEMHRHCAPLLFRHVQDRRPGGGGHPAFRAPLSDELRFVRDDGRAVWMAVSFDQTNYENQPVFIVWLYDVTERKEQAEALRGAKDAAEQALADLERMQGDLIRAEKMAVIGQLIAAVAHEINTPVGIALTAATHLQTASDSIILTFKGGQLRRSDFQDYVGTASEVSTLLVSNIERAAALIQSLKLVTEGKAGSPRSRFDLRDYLSDIVLAVQVQPTAAGHELLLDCPDGLALESYPGALTEVLLALLANAFAHGFETRSTPTAPAPVAAGCEAEEDPPRPGGRVTVSARLTADDRVELRVSDNGRGIPEEIQPRLFQPFATTRRGSGSMGLGLYAVFNLVTGRLGGEIDIESVPGTGTSVILRLPMDAP
ncbi:hybrid sensor histidine kinase/response regulator [Azospirillum picis]|uniref:histidine kinase n=1 Tax=Azospirillum picis TaxID=488438 RepID=A0ABU0MIC4_9PROT|nr:ATP-binding protein [Azospirillum picis]MBP2299663.1 PAS domain S-box-containing protein [Azospirillum picis]MDQ0533210.1 PAS domain S-box-containing protein [Azospirillum picis]